MLTRRYLFTHVWHVSTGCLTLCFFVLIAANSGADSVNVTIINPSFEALDAADVSVAAASRWSTNTLATFDPGNDQFTGTTGNDVQGELPGGGQVGNLDIGRVLSQNLGVSGIVGATYTLDYFQGVRRSGGPTGPHTYRVELLEGVTTIFSQDVTASTLGFEAAPQLSGVATGTGELTLQFTSLSGQAFIDLPSLTVEDPSITSINVPNFSFDSPDPNDLSATTPSAWTATGLSTTVGVFDPQDAQFPATTGNNELGGLAGMDGQIGNIEGADGSLSQNLGVTIGPNDTVYLNVAIGNRAQTDLNPDYTLELLLDGVVFESITNPVIPELGELAVAELIGTPPGVGELGIRFQSNSGQTFLDDVIVFTTSSSVQAVPEPYSIMIWMILGSIGIGYCMARRHKARS